MKKNPTPIAPDAATYFIAKRMEGVGMLRPGQALMLAATVGLRKPDVKKPQSRGKTATTRRGKS